MRHVLGFFNRLAYSVSFAFISWALAAVPLGIGRDVQRVTAFVVGLPLALVWWFLPQNWRGIDVISRGSFGEWLGIGEGLWFHLRAAVPTYLVLFYLPSALAILWRLARRQVQGRGAAQPTEQQAHTGRDSKP